jgi:hypothetical protein
MIISVDSHDVLGKLSIVKNYLSVLLENKTLSEKDKEYIKRAIESNEFLISLVKEKTQTISSIA